MRHQGEDEWCVALPKDALRGTRAQWWEDSAAGAARGWGSGRDSGESLPRPRPRSRPSVLASRAPPGDPASKDTESSGARTKRRCTPSRCEPGGGGAGWVGGLWGRVMCRLQAWHAAVLASKPGLLKPGLRRLRRPVTAGAAARTRQGPEAAVAAGGVLQGQPGAHAGQRGGGQEGRVLVRHHLAAHVRLLEDQHGLRGRGGGSAGWWSADSGAAHTAVEVAG